ncbi:hypothetical protein BH11PSE5_BH11PSE5_20960 [soil metagenome]
MCELCRQRAGYGRICSPLRSASLWGKSHRTLLGIKSLVFIKHEGAACYSAQLIKLYLVSICPLRYQVAG